MIYEESEKGAELLQVPEKDEELITLRPRFLAEYVAQERVVETLKIAIDAARVRGEPLEHILFNGPPGLGKTTLAHIIAREMGTRIVTSSGPALEKGGDLIGLLTHLERGDIFFIDEIHRLPKVVEEFLYPAMEDFAVDFIFDKGVHARTHRYRLEQFTLIGATTRSGMLSSPLRERFGIVRDLDFYNEEELLRIVLRSAAILGIAVDERGASEIAKRARGTPRIANRLLKRVRDFAQVRADGRITREVAVEALGMFEVDEKGFDHMDRTILLTVIEKFDGGPVGIDNLSAAIGEERTTIEDVYEPFLIQEGYLQRTARGRVATRRAYEHLGRRWVGGNQKELF